MDPRKGFTQSVDLTTAVVADFPSLLFFCGGRILDPSSPEPGSVRDAVFRAFTIKHAELSRRIFLAEEFNDWMYDGVYSELFSFERDLASLSSAIVLFLESAGSIAELGAFSQQDGVKQKLLIFLRTEHYQQDSFIKLGPIKYLEDSDAGSIRAYPWQTVSLPSGDRIDVESLTESMDEICDSISDVFRSKRLHRQFSLVETRDRMLLIRDLITQMMGLKIREIQDYLLDVGVDVDTRRLRQYLYVLQTLNLIEMVPRGKDRYFVSKDSRRFIRLGTKDGLRIDDLRLQMEVAAYYKQHDISRFRAIAPILARQEGE
jgi:hypothetical protein